MKNPFGRYAALTLLTVLVVTPLAADTPIGIARSGELDPISVVPVVAAPAVDLQAVTAEDLDRELAGLAPRFAIPNEVSITPDLDGQWETLNDGTMVWRLRVASPGAVSLNLGFTEFEMPTHGRLQVYGSDGSNVRRAFTVEDNASHGELWTPIYLTDEIVVELTVPLDERNDVRLKLDSVNVGYREFGVPNTPESGSCNVDVVCPDGDGWRGEIPAIAAISTGGSLFCSGFMVNNTAQDQTPYFMTAYHCNITPLAAASLVAYWNFEASSCGGARDGQLNQFNTGSFFRSQYSSSDFTLVELDSDPDPAWGITFAGWDRSGNEAATAIAIHHPSVDEKAISFEYQSTTTTSYLGTSVPGNGTHVRVADWDSGTTEPGSSGSPLFNQNHHVIGQLHGGYAACSNNSADWYGKMSVSWTGGGTSNSRLSNWLDPGNTGAMSVNTLVPGGCTNNGDCDDGAFCNGAETCNGSTCQAGSDPCPNQDCDEASDTCIPLVCDGDGTCESGEDCNNCGNDCFSGGASCGNGICETADGEDCFSCAADCNGRTNGNPANRYCCGNGQDCTDSRCTNGNQCTDSPSGSCCGNGICEGAEDSGNCAVDCGPPPVCGDASCDPGEDSCNCASDCGAPPATEGQCTNGDDDDCDGDVDCDDADCSGDAACQGCTLAGPGDACNSNSECCSGRCKGNGTCK